MGGQKNTSSIGRIIFSFHESEPDTTMLDLNNETNNFLLYFFVYSSEKWLYKYMNKNGTIIIKYQILVLSTLDFSLHLLFFIFVQFHTSCINFFKLFWIFHLIYLIFLEEIKPDAH